MINKKTNNATGKLGEDLAALYLAKKGFEIIERNYRIKRFEIDIIAKHQQELVFIEVKTRRNDLVAPELAVNKAKQLKLAEAANLYLENISSNLPLRFDVVSVVFKKNKINIEHFEDAFYPFIVL